jgi:hypothetical protein
MLITFYIENGTDIDLWTLAELAQVTQDFKKKSDKDQEVQQE